MNRKHSLKVGDKIGKLTVIEFAYTGKHYRKYWHCICDCGNKSIIPETCLTRKKKTKSCGCLKITVGKQRQGRYIAKKPGWEPGAWRMYKKYRDGDIGFEKFIELSKLPCHYCGTVKSNRFNPYITRDGRPRPDQRVTQQRIDEAWFEYNGLDRIDNTLGHTLSNCVPCCGICNKMKINHSQEVFIQHCKKVSEYSG